MRIRDLLRMYYYGLKLKRMAKRGWEHSSLHSQFYGLPFHPWLFKVYARLGEHYSMSGRTVTAHTIGRLCRNRDTRVKQAALVH